MCMFVFLFRKSQSEGICLLWSPMLDTDDNCKDQSLWDLPTNYTIHNLIIFNLFDCAAMMEFAQWYLLWNSSVGWCSGDPDIVKKKKKNYTCAFCDITAVIYFVRADISLVWLPSAQHQPPVHRPSCIYVLIITKSDLDHILCLIYKDCSLLSGSESYKRP